MLLHTIRLASPLLFSLAALSLHGQDTPQNPSSAPPLLQTNAHAVSVDVVATDNAGDPVLALHQQDFQIFEDGKPQAIDLFEEHSANAGSPSIAAVSLPPHVYTNLPTTPQSDAVNILLLDSLNTIEADQAFVHKQIADFVKNMPPGMRIAVFTLNQKLRLLQGFTSDSNLLRTALDRKAAAPGVTAVSRTRDDDLRDKEELAIVGEMSNTGGADAEAPLAAIRRSQADVSTTQAGSRSSMTLAALQQIARATAAISVRKNLIWFAGSFPVSIFPNGPSRQTMANGKEIGDAARETANLLTQAKVALYPISAQGIVLDRTTNADSAGQPNGDDFEKNPNQDAAANSANSGAMEQLAADTGGKAFYTSNNLSQSIAGAIQNGSHYYTLVYTPPGTAMEGKFHRIEVKLTGSKAKLSYRRGYYADTAAGANAKVAPISDPLPQLLAHGLPASTQVLYQARVEPRTPQPAAGAPRAGGNSKLTGTLIRYKVDLVILPATISLNLAPDLTHNGKIEVALVAYDPAGKPVNWTGQTLGLVLNPTSYAQVQHAGIPIHLQIDLPLADLSLSTGVYDLNAHRAGTLEIPIGVN